MSRYRRSGSEDLYGLLRNVFCAAAITCFLWASHRIGASLKTEARLRALEQTGEAFTPEEREKLIEKIKAGALHY